MADNEIRNPAKAYFKWKMPVITKSEDDWNFWNTEDKYNRTMFIGYNDTTTPHVASLFMIVDGKPTQAVGDDVIARIAGLETNAAQALADIQALIDRVNAQQLDIDALKQECYRILNNAKDAVTDAQTWAEGTDEEVADLGGEHSAKGWAQKANDIVAAGLPSDATFDHITVTSSSKFGQDPDRGNQPGLEIEGTGEIQAYRTVNMMNGATVSYDETVEMPWSDSSNKVPNTAWVQQAVQHGTIDPNTELTVKKISTTGGGAWLYGERIGDSGGKSLAYLTVHKPASETDGAYITLHVNSENLGYGAYFEVGEGTITMSSRRFIYFDHGDKTANAEAIRIGQAASQAYATKRYLYSELVGRLANGLQIGLVGANEQDGVPFKVLRSDNTTIGKWTAAFGVTPTVPDITNAADSSDKVPNTKWVQAAIAAGGGGGSSGAVTSVNGKTGEVVLAATDVGAATTADITTALEPYAKTADVTTTLADYAKSADVTTEISTATAGLQPKLTAGANITISEDNVISATGSTGGAVTSVNGKTGEVVLSASDVGAASSSDLASYVTTDAMNTELTNFATTASVDTKLADYQPKLTAGEGIAISESNVISVTGGTGGGAVSSVNGKTGEVVLNATDVGAITGAEADTKITTALEPYAKSADVTADIDAVVEPLATTEALTTGLASKQDKLTAESDLTVGSLTAGPADSGLYAGQHSMRFSSNGTDKLFVDASGLYVSNLAGGYRQSDTGAFNWCINTTTDYNKFNVLNRYYVTDAETHEVTPRDTSVLSIGGSPDDHSTWIDFTANYLSFKGNANFGEYGMNHIMNFNGPSTFSNEASFRGNTHINGNTTFWKVDAEGGSTPWASFDKSTGMFNIDYLTSSDGGNAENRVTIMADSREANYGATFNLPVTVSDASFKRTSTLAADDNSTEVPTTAWVKAAIAAGGSSVPDDITCKTLGVTDTGTVHILNVGDGKEGQNFNCGCNANFGYDVNLGWLSGRFRCMRDEYNWLFDFNRNANTENRLRFNEPVTILYPMPASTDSSTKVPTTAWVQGAIAAKAATKPTLTYAKRSSTQFITTKVEQCTGGKLCTIYWQNSIVINNGTYYIDVPTEFADATIASTVFTSNDRLTPAVWVAASALTAGKIKLDVASTNTTSGASASAIIVLAAIG